MRRPRSNHGGVLGVAATVSGAAFDPQHHYSHLTGSRLLPSGRRAKLVLRRAWGSLEDALWHSIASKWPSRCSTPWCWLITRPQARNAPTSWSKKLSTSRTHSCRNWNASRTPEAATPGTMPPHPSAPRHGDSPCRRATRGDSWLENGDCRHFPVGARSVAHASAKLAALVERAGCGGKGRLSPFLGCHAAKDPAAEKGDSHPFLPRADGVVYNPLHSRRDGCMP